MAEPQKNNVSLLAVARDMVLAAFQAGMQALGGLTAAIQSQSRVRAVEVAEPANSERLRNQTLLQLESNLQVVSAERDQALLALENSRKEAAAVNEAKWASQNATITKIVLDYKAQNQKEREKLSATLAETIRQSNANITSQDKLVRFLARKLDQNEATNRRLAQRLYQNEATNRLQVQILHANIRELEAKLEEDGTLARTRSQSLMDRYRR